MPRNITKLHSMQDVLLPSPADPSLSKPHALTLAKLKIGKPWHRLRAQLSATDIDEIGGLLCTFESRAANVLAGLLAGKSPAGAAAAVMLTRQAVDHWRRAVPEFAAAYDAAASLGFALNYEEEAESRALAGPDDRGSVRLLELMLKARGGDAYRDKSEVTTRHLRGEEAVNKVMTAMEGLDGSWSVDPTT